MTKLRIADGLALPADAVTQTFGVLAKRGAGKSNAAAVLAEQMHAAGAQFVVVDPVGAWWGLRSSADGKGPGLSIAVLGGHHNDLPLDPGAGELVADLVVDERISCVLDVSAFDSESAKRRFLTAFANRLFRQKGRPGSGDPLHLFLEEADDYAPQMAGRGEREHEGGRGACLGAFQRLVKQGRARGIGCTMITQRSAALNKDLLTQIETLIVLRTTAPNDRKAIEGWVKYHDVDGAILASLSELAVGEAWVWSPSWLGIVKRVQMPRRSTYDSGATATGSSKSKPVATLADVDLTALRARMAATIEKAKADDPRELRKQIAELQRELAAAKKGTPPKVERVEVPILSDLQAAAVDRFAGQASGLEAKTKELADAARQLTDMVRLRADGFKAAASKVVHQPPPQVTSSRRAQRTDVAVPVSSPQKRGQNRNNGDGGELTDTQQRILDTIAMLEERGIAVGRVSVARWMGIHPNGGRYGQDLARLRGGGFLDGFALAGGEPRAIETGEGAAIAAACAIDPSCGTVLSAVIGAARPLTRETLAELLGIHPNGGRYGQNLARLRDMGLIPDRGPIVPTEGASR